MENQQQQTKGQKVKYRADRPEHERKVSNEPHVPMLRPLCDLAVDLVHWDRHLGDGVEQVVEQYLHWEHRQERQDQGRPCHREHVPEIRAHRHHDELHDIAERSAPFDDAAIQRAEILLQQDDVGCVLGDIDRAVDGYADVGSVQRWGVVYAVAEKADDMAAVLQTKDDPVLLNGRHPAEYVRLFQPRRQRFITELFDLGAGQQPGDRDAELGADVLRHMLVVAGKDLNTYTLES